jgi:DNA modification methylase
VTATEDPLSLEYVPLADLKADPSNPKQHSIDTIDASIGRFGVAEIISIDDRTGYIISGHGRTKTLRAMQERGDTPPKGVKVDDNGDWLVPILKGWSSRTDQDARAALIALNRTTELGGWIDEALLEHLQMLAAEEALDGVGFDEDDIEALRARLADLDSDKADPWSDRNLQTKPASGDVKFGQVYRIGSHLIGCGDSRNPQNWKSLLGDVQPALMFTDPPYGIDYSGGGGVEREKLEGDGADEAIPLFAAVLDALLPLMKPGASTYTCLPSGDIFPQFVTLLSERDLYRWMIVWVKDRATFGRADYHQQHEVILYGWLPNGPHHPVVDRKQTSVWSVDRPKDSDDHPTAKPVGLALKAILNSTDEGDVVVDPFGGSFSTCQAAQEAGRASVSIEWEPGYVAAALRRLEAVTGETAMLVEDLTLEEWSGQFGEGFTGGWVPFKRLFGTNVIPPDAAGPIADAVRKIVDEEGLGVTEQWRALEFLAAEYLGG